VPEFVLAKESLKIQKIHFSRKIWKVWGHVFIFLLFLLLKLWGKTAKKP
jgi:hypothetical protein